MRNKINAGKTALITGGSSGIGLALARLLASRGINIWLLARNVERLEEAKEIVSAACQDSGQQVLTISLELTNDQQAAIVLPEFFRRHGTPDLLINSAGAAHPGEFQNTSMDTFRSMMEANFFSMVNVTRAVVGLMAERGSGHIVNISSIAGFTGVYGYSAYGASKFAVRGFSDVLRAEMKHHGVQVSIVFPPDTDTPQLAYENQFKPAITKALSANTKAISADVAAAEILKGIDSGRYIIIPSVDGTWLFRLNNLLGCLFYPFMDYMVRRARRQVSAIQDIRAQNHQADPHQISEQ